jgi:hypothetical protein
MHLRRDCGSAMSTKNSIQFHDEEHARFHLYSECFDPIEFVYLELEGVQFEAQSSIGLSGTGLSSVTVRLPVRWATDAILGFQKAALEAFVPIDVRNRARQVFKKDDAARTWLLSNLPAFGGRSAVDLCIEGDAEVVMIELGIIDGECWA